MADENVLKFVLLLEEHIDVLIKSQTTASKNRKNEAVALIIPKWEEISNIKLTQASLFKKINNLKTRAKSVLRSGKTVTEWQAKLLNIIQIDNDDEEAAPHSNQIVLVDESSTDAQSTNQKVTAEQVLNKLETDETKVLSNEQLKRYVLLQQVRVLTLQQSRLEHLNSIENGKDVTIDFIGFEEDVEGDDSHVAKP